MLRFLIASVLCLLFVAPSEAGILRKKCRKGIAKKAVAKVVHKCHGGSCQK